MAKPKLLVLKGLPASGKSTYAKRMTEQGYIRINKDDLRESLFGGNYKRKDEKTIIRVRNAIIEDALSHNKSVVVDDTNLNPIHIKDLTAVARKFNVEFEVNDSFLNVSIEECIKRDLLRPKSVGERVIRDMFYKWVHKPMNAPVYDPELPNCYIVDIDGTLAHMAGKRGPYEYGKVGGDEADPGVSHVVDAIGLMDYAKVIIFSGRDEVCKPETVAWLEQNDIEYEEIHMRRSNHLDDKGHQVADTIVKREMYEKYVEGKYNVLGVIDDRPVVCRMWRDDLGLPVFQVGNPYLEF